MNVPEILTGGGVVGLIWAAGYVGRLGLDTWRAKRAGPREESAAWITDAAAANAVLVTTIGSLQAENRRMGRKIQHLEQEAREKDRKITELEQRVPEVVGQDGSGRDAAGPGEARGTGGGALLRREFRPPVS